MKKRWVKILIGLCVVAVAMWLSFLGSGSRENSKVQRYRDELRAAGEKLEIKEIIPTNLPPDQNYVGLVREAISNPSLSLEDAVSTNQPPAIIFIQPGRAMIGSRQPFVTHDDATNDWEDFKPGLSARAPVLEVLHQLPEGARFDFQLDYSRGVNLLLPHLAKMKALSQLLWVATEFDLHRGDAASAATNIQTSLTLVQGYADEPLLISQLVRIATAQITLPPQWDWLQATNVTEPELAALQKSWADLAFVQPMERALLMERVIMAMTIEKLRSSNTPSAGLSWSPGSSGGGSGDWLDGLKELGESMKRGAADQLWKSSWSYSDELRLLQGQQVLIEAARQIRADGYFQKALTNCDYQLDTRGLNKASGSWLRVKLGDQMEIISSVESLTKLLNKVLIAETARQLAITALALKRYQLRHGNYPADLKMLAPEFLDSVPRDPVDGQPLRYRLNPDGTFLLYSIGEDGKDEGGNPSPTTSASRSFNLFRAHDWVWPQPATESEVQAGRVLDRYMNAPHR